MKTLINKIIETLPSKQDILTLREFVIVANRLRRIHRLTLKINKLHKKRGRLIDMNIAEYMNNHEPTTIDTKSTLSL